VKDVALTDRLEGYCERVLSLVPRALGPRLGRDVQRVIKAVKAGDWSVDGDTVTAGGVELRDGEYELKMVAADQEHSAPLPGGEGVVVLDTEVTPELAAEGLARDVVRVVQTARREAGLEVSDRIRLTLDAPAEVSDAVRPHLDFVQAETLTRDLRFGSLAGRDAFTGEAGDGQRVSVLVERA
jgi:isoleucyl-tRNA synthetase